MTTLNTEKGKVLYAKNDGIFYYTEPDITKKQGKADRQQYDPTANIDNFVGKSTGQVNGDFVEVNWVNRYETHGLFGFKTGTNNDDMVGWVLLSDVKNTTSEEDDQALLQQNSDSLKGLGGAGGGKPKAQSNTLIYVVLGVVFLLTIIIVIFKFTSKPKAVVPPVVPPVPVVASTEKPKKK